MIEEGKEFSLVLFKTLLILHRYFSLILSSGEIVVEMPNGSVMLSQKSRFQSEGVNCLDDSFKDQGKLVDEILQFSIERLLEESVIQVSHQMYQALLLRTVHRVICRIKIGH